MCMFPSPGEDFVRNLGIKTLDFATIHVYPCNWGIPASQYQWVNDNYIGDRASLTASNGKPLMFEVRANPHLHLVANSKAYPPGKRDPLRTHKRFCMDPQSFGPTQKSSSALEVNPPSKRIMVLGIQKPYKAKTPEIGISSPSRVRLQEYGMPRGYMPSRNTLFNRCAKALTLSQYLQHRRF